MENLYRIFLLFIIYSFIGWIMEVIVKFVEKKRFINRGFLIGPLCPIYGYGAILILLLLRPYKRSVILLFFMAILICSFLEYMTSFVMEKLFKTRWWDYSDVKYNINGRICLNTMLPFGVLGVVVFFIVNPFIKYLLSFISYDILKIVAILLFAMYLIDNIITFFIINKYRDSITNIEKDSTEEIVKIREKFMKKGFLYSRLIKAFPTMKSTKERLIALRNRINRELYKYR